MTWTLVGLCVLAFAVSSVSGLPAFAAQFGMTPFAVAEGEIWRLLTSSFLHAGLIHLGFNMLVLYLLGPTLETILGHLWFLMLYVLSALGGATFSYLFLVPAGVSIGASGAIFGLMGALIVAGRRFSFDVRQVVILLAINLAISFLLGSFIDWRAHVGGLVVGTVVAVILAYPPDRHATAYRVAGCALVLVAMAAVIGWRSAELARSPASSPGSLPLAATESLEGLGHLHGGARLVASGPGNLSCGSRG